MMRVRYPLHALLAAVALATPDSAATQSPRMGAREITVGARSWWLSCAGRGAPLVLLEAGHTEGSDTWTDVQHRVASFTRVCSYDRAGVGRSTAAPATRERTGRDVAQDLRSLLRAAGERGPLVLVGHSLGGPFVRLFAATAQDTIAGMVLVDAVHEREFQAIDSILTPAQRAASAGMRPMSPERLDVEGVLREVREIAKPMRWPLVVIARGTPLDADEMPPSWSADQRTRRETLRVALHRELATLSPEGRLVVAAKSGHHVHHDEPDVVVAAVRDLVDRYRQHARPSR